MYCTIVHINVELHCEVYTLVPQFFGTFGRQGLSSNRGWVKREKKSHQGLIFPKKYENLNFFTFNLTSWLQCCGWGTRQYRMKRNVWESILEKGNPTTGTEQLQLKLTSANMGSLWSKVVFLAFFTYFSYEVWKSIGKFQSKGGWTFTKQLTWSDLELSRSHC